MKRTILFGLLLLQTYFVSAQNFTHRDSLQGGLRNERICFDVQRYDLNITVNSNDNTIVGYNEISFKVLNNTSTIQIDLFENMQIDSIIYNKKVLRYNRDLLATFINFPEELKVNSQQKIKFYYSGKPVQAKNAPWDGGIVIKKDKNDKPWIGMACQGFGASCWFPVKDSQTDEPDFGATIKVAVPNGLMNVSNGRFIGKEDLKNGYTRWDWEVKNPINSYDITINIGDYVHFGEKYKDLDLDYYVLRENEQKAKEQFKEVKPMMDCFQSKFGTYPFANDGYKLVDTPYLGMEHQSAVAYGNGYLKGYKGRDLSGTGVGMLFDYIIIHESGHEWFGNSITSKDIADMWIHEGFTMYTEVVYLECRYGYQKAMEYMRGLQYNIKNDSPIIGSYGVNKEGSGDMYPKGSSMLNTIRHIVNNDDKWWAIILKYSQTYRHKIIDTQTVIDFFNTETGINLTPVFDQYLRYQQIPELEFRNNNNAIEYRWNTDVKNFEMPVDITIKNNIIRLYGTNNWKKITEKTSATKDIEVLQNKFYVKVKM